MFLPVSVASAADAQNPAVDPSTTDLVSAVQDLQKEQEDKEKKDTDKKSDDSQRAANNDDKTATEGTTEQKSEEDKDKAPASEDEKKDDSKDDPTKPDPMSESDLAKLLRDHADSFKQADGTYRIGNPLPGGKATGTVPAGLEAYYSQTFIGWQSCDNYYYNNPIGYFPLNERAMCGYLLAPIDYSNPSKGNVALFVYKLPATGKRSGTLFFNNGGPGGSPVKYVNSYSYNGSSEDQYMAKLNETYDLVGMDPRGVPNSLPFSQCAKTEDAEEKEPQPYPDDIAKATEDNVNGTHKYVNSCFEYTGKAFGWDADTRASFLKNVGTSNAARDMDVLRSVLGESKLDYVGLSYGTRLGYVYAQNFPQNVNRFVLDGALNPFNSTAPTEADKTPNLTDEQLRKLNAHYLSQGREFQATFEKFAQWCYALPNANEECALKFPEVQPKEGDLADDDVSPATQQIQNILRPLVKKPLSFYDSLDGKFSWGLSFDTANTAVAGGMYDESSWETVAKGLKELVRPSKDKELNLSEFKRLYERYRTSGNYGQAAFNTINCADSANPDGASVENHKRVQQMYYKEAPFRDPGKPYNQSGDLSTCSAWPFAGTLAAGTEIKNLPNVLVVSTTNDPATAYANGEVLARALFGTELTVQGAQHVAFDRTESDYECANNIIVDYLLNGTVPADGEYPKICSIKSFRPTEEPVEPENPNNGNNNQGNNNQNTNNQGTKTPAQGAATHVAGKSAKGIKLAATGSSVVPTVVLAVALVLTSAAALSIRKLTLK